MSVFRHPAAALGSNSGLRNWFGDGSDGDLRLTVAAGAEQSFDGVSWSPMPGWTNTAGLITVPSVQDGDMVVVNARNLTVEAGVTLTTANRCRGL
ncbi:hypothetical protein, partial [Desulfovibrio psychrotolerans]|uniref:hypothetical protein n=1 Tax=Desulfovibrio psychrotolerans TaxID=415242 RepID=UPI00157AABD3